ncbi:FAD:protein FMN transferase [Gammaproteobacteria bacterium]
MRIAVPRRLFLILFPIPLAICLLAALIIPGCSGPEDRTIERQIYVFGTIVTLSFYGIDEPKADEAAAEIDRLFQQMHHDWHAWQKGALADLNQAIAEGRPAPVPASLIPLIEKSREACLKSDGLFNPAIGRLVALWGFHSSELPSGPLPAPEAIEALVQAHPSMADIDINDGVLTALNRAVRMDLGGIAKGYAVELALKRLRQLGVQNAIVNAGGGLGIIGRHGDRSWRIGIRHPLGPGVLGTLAVFDGENVHTSGNYERYREYEGRRYSHIIDPRTGWPVQEVVSATVIHADGAFADAFTKPLIIGGTREWYRIAKTLGLQSAMLVDSEGTVYMDPSMAQRVQFEGVPPKVVVSDPLY